MTKNQKNIPGSRLSSLVFAATLLFLILGTVVALSSLTALETKISQKNQSSSETLSNAGSGAEWALKKIAGADKPDETLIGSLFSAASDDKTIACPPDLGCEVYFLKADGSVADPAVSFVSDIADIRSVGARGEENRQAAVEEALAAPSGGGCVVLYTYNDFCTGEDCCKDKNGKVIPGFKSIAQLPQPSVLTDSDKGSVFAPPGAYSNASTSTGDWDVELMMMGTYAYLCCRETSL